MGIHDNTVHITPPEVALTSDITANLSHINPLDNTTSMGVNFYQNALAYFYKSTLFVMTIQYFILFSVDITLFLINVTSDY